MAKSPDTPLQKLEKQIRTFTWFQYILDKNDVSSEKQLIDKLSVELNLSVDQLGYLKKFENYSPHSQKKFNASQGTLSRIEEFFPGSTDIYLNGPEESNLFSAIFEKIDYLSKTENKKFHQYDLKKALRSYHNTDHNKLNLKYLSNYTILFRYYLKRNQYANSNLEVEDITSTLINIIESKNIKKQLEHFGIRDVYLQWLYKTLEGWCITSISFMDGYLPTEEQFIENPKNFIRLMLDDIAVKPESLNSLSDLETSKLLEKKAALWLPNEDIIKIQLKQSMKDSYKAFKTSFHAFIETRKPRKIFNSGIRKASYRVFKVKFYAFIETRQQMKNFNQIIRFTSIVSMLFFSFFTMVFIAKTTLSMAAFSLLCFMVSALLYKDVTKITKRNIFT